MHKYSTCINSIDTQKLFSVVCVEIREEENAQLSQVITEEFF